MLIKTTDEKQVAQFKKEFQKMDKDNTGSVDRTELKKAFIGIS